ncbi:MAG: hypothetical protein EAZ91_23780 [Cytophagales bacterium]|nr:MAG: hypothetical protein EAZ91_23780 [Cytophagales bacterium]
MSNWKAHVLIWLLVCLSAGISQAQEANLGACNTGTTVPWVNGGAAGFTSLTVSSVGLANPDNATNSTLTDAATASWGGFSNGSVTLTVGHSHTYSAGNYVGFKVSASGGTLNITTFRSGSVVESQNVGLQGGDFEAGFEATAPYDAIRVTFTKDFLPGGGISVFHAIMKRNCAGPTPPECNSAVALTSPAYPVEVNNSNEGFPIIGSSVVNPTAVISTSLTDFAVLNLGTGNAYVGVKDRLTTFPAGTFAGFDVENIDFVNDKFGGLKVTTFLNGNQQEQSGVFNILLLASSDQSLVSMGVDPVGRQTVGYVTTKPFDEVRITYSKIDNPLSGNEHETKVYSAILDKRCAGAEFVCNTAANFSFPGFPVSEYSGQAGGCLSTMGGQGALVSADTSDYISIIDGAQVGCNAFVGIRNTRPGDVYPAGTFAGFEINQIGIISLSAADFGTVTTYLDGVEQESNTAANLIATSFVIGKKRIVGFRTTKPFDEVKYSRLGLVSIGLTTTRIHRAVIEKICPGPALPCNVMTTLNKPTFPVTTTSYMVPYGVIVGCAGTVTGEDAVVSPDPNDFALMTMVQSLGCNRFIATKDNSTTFAAGTYAGVEIENQSLITASIGDFQFVKTFLNGQFQEQSIRGSAVTATILTGGRQIFGFKTTKPFDEIRYEEFTVITPATLVATRVYGMVVQTFCPGTIPVCSTPNNIPGDEADYARLNNPESSTSSNTGFPVTLETKVNDSFLGVSVCTNQLLNPERAISASINDYAEIGLTGVNCAASMSFELNSQSMVAGTWAGIEIENTTALNIDLINGVTIQTMLGGAVQESRTAAGLIDLTAGGNTKRKLGFVTSKPYDRIKYIQASLIGIALGTTRVYGALVRELCAAPPLVCNEKKTLSAPEYPISTNAYQGGGCISGVANPEALGTADPNDYAFFSLGINIACERILAVRDHKTVYPAGTYAGFDVQLNSLVEIAFNSYKIRTLLNGVQQEEINAAFEVSYGLYAGSMRLPVGIKTTMPFDEIQFVMGSGVAVSVTEVRVYNAFVIKPCEPATVACNTTYELTPDPTGFPIVIDGAKTGITGACLGCGISYTENILSPQTDDYAEIVMVAALLNEAKIAVRNPLISYPTGTRVGFTYQNVGGIFDAALFNATKIRTYLNGVLQEEKSSTNLLEIPILTDWNSQPVKNIGFEATKAFDEVQLAFTNTNGTFRVYGAFVDTRNSAGSIGSTALSCSCASGTVSPALTLTALTNTCPVQTVDLNTAFTGTAPANTTLVWATGPIATTGNVVANPETASAGIYYAAFYDPNNICYSPGSTSLVFTLTPCTAPSLTVLSPGNGATASTNPTISGTATPGSVVTVTGGSGSSGGPVSVTAGVTGTWSTAGLTFPAGPAQFTAVAGNSLGTSPEVPVSYSAVAIPSSLTLVSSPSTLTGVQGSNLTGSVPSVLSPTGGTAPYAYKVYDPTNPSSVPGNSSPTAHGTVTVNPTTGAFTYTPAPGYSGPDSIGMRVCDSSSPTPTCQMKTVPVNVSALSTNCAPPAVTITK